jgi:hypothetical protein
VSTISPIRSLLNGMQCTPPLTRLHISATAEGGEKKEKRKRNGGEKRKVFAKLRQQIATGYEVGGVWLSRPRRVPVVLPSCLVQKQQLGLATEVAGRWYSLCAGKLARSERQKGEFCNRL